MSTIPHPPIAICNLYPPDYWNLQGVTPLQAPPELWWSSKERKAIESGASTFEYLELDFGRIRSFNFLSFNIVQKPITILVEYDVWGYDSGVKRWESVTRLANERFDDYVSFQSNAANPWKNCQFYFTNDKSDMISARYLRLRFARRNEPWPNSTIAGTFPWSIDLKDLRTSRYVITLNDTRGIMLQQGKVTAPIHDPVRSIDADIVTMVFEDTSELDEAIITMTGTPSGVEQYDQAVPEAQDGETYFAIMVSNDSCGIYSAGEGNGGMSCVVNGNGQLNGTNNNSGSHNTDSTTITVTEYTDVNETGHLASDMPSFGTGWAFFFPHPTDTETFAWMIAMGTAASAGNETTALTSYARGFNGSASTVVQSNNFSPPAAGDVMTYAIIVGNSETITDDSPLTADGWVLQVQHDIDIEVNTTGFTLYFYTKVATGSEGGSYPYPTVTLSATTKWATTFAYLATPSDPTGHCYLIDAGAVGDDGDVAGSPGLTFFSSEHGGFI